MALLNVFEGSAFSMMSLTAALNKMPYQPRILGDLGLFTSKPIRTTVAMVEEQHGTLSLLNSAARGDKVNARSVPDRETRAFSVPHYPQVQTIRADDIQNIRAFGSESELTAIGSHVNEQLGGMRENHEASFEWQRAGAIQGILLDGDGTTELYDLFAEFGGITRTAVDFVFSVATTEIKATCQAVIRAISDALGATTYTEIIGLAGDAWFDDLTGHATVKNAYERWVGSDRSAGTFFRTTQLGPGYPISSMNGFPFGDITFINYRGNIGAQLFVPTDECQFVVRGVPDLFQHIQAPANFMETVNTAGQPMYAKQRRLDFDEGVELFTQANSLIMCTRPASLIQGTQS